MTKLIDLTGKRFGRWTVVGPAGLNEKRERLWLVKCDCGNEKKLRGLVLKKGISKSCGCLAADVQRERITKYAYPVRTGAMQHIVEKDGRKQTLAEWAKELGFHPAVLNVRWDRGWEDHEILKPTKAMRERSLDPTNPESLFYKDDAFMKYEDVYKRKEQEE